MKTEVKSQNATKVCVPPENFIPSRDGPVKVQKQGRDENTKEGYPTVEQWRKRTTVGLPYISCMYSRYR